MSEILTEVPNACALACPTAAARNLSELSRQYEAPEQWLFSNPEDRETIGLFSVDAVRTVVTNYNVADPVDHPRYGTPRTYVDIDQAQLQAIHRGIGDGRPISPEEVSYLSRMAHDRTNQRSEFAELPIHEQQRRAKAAKPLLDEVAVSLLDRNPDLAELQELTDILAAREEEDTTVSLARELMASTKSIERVHGLDQGPFLVARQALQACGGPMAYTKPRFVIPGIWRPVGTKTGNVCPIGDKRDMTYFTAQMQSEQQNPK